jgi:hypothetical protein
MEYSDGSVEAHPEYHSSLRLIQKLDDFWFYGNLKEEQNATNPSLCLSLVGLRPHGSIEMVDKKKIFLRDSEEEEEEEAEGEEERGAIASSSARSKLNAYLPCARFESMASISRSEAATEHREGQQNPIEMKSTSSSFPTRASARSAVAMMPTNVQNGLDDDDSPAASQIEVRTFYVYIRVLFLYFGLKEIERISHGRMKSWNCV